MSNYLLAYKIGKELLYMKRKNTNIRYRIVCRSRSKGAGITSEDRTHICLDRAETIHIIMNQWHDEHLDNCACVCRDTAHCIPQEEYLF